MDITKELKDLSQDNNFGEDLIEQLKLKEEEIRKKRYLIRVIALTKRFDNIISTKLLENAGIEFIKLQFDILRTITNKSVYTFSFNFLDKNRDLVSLFVNNREGVITDEASYINKLFNKFLLPEGLPQDLVGNKINDRFKCLLTLNLQVNDQILDVLLSDELKTIYEYNTMQIDLSSNVAIGKKSKI